MNFHLDKLGSLMFSEQYVETVDHLIEISAGRPMLVILVFIGFASRPVMHLCTSQRIDSGEPPIVA